MRNLMYVGPTALGIDQRLLAESQFEVLPPLRRGTIRALHVVPPGRIAIVDGLFHETLAVGHAELRQALALGWEIWGLASMGAIRAFEMASLGMRGFGCVYGYFLTARDFQDDEVALLHSPEPPYQQISEPLTHLRHLTARFEAEGLLTTTQAEDVVSQLKRLWFGYRTVERFLDIVVQKGGLRSASAVRERATALLPSCRQKTQDLRDFLVEQPWLTAPRIESPAAAPYAHVS